MVGFCQSDLHFYFTAADLSPESFSNQINFNLRLSSRRTPIHFTNKVKSTLGVRVNIFIRPTTQECPNSSCSWLGLITIHDDHNPLYNIRIDTCSILFNPPLPLFTAASLHFTSIIHLYIHTLAHHDTTWWSILNPAEAIRVTPACGCSLI